MPRVNFLATPNMHRRDSRVVFYDDTHAYYVDGERTLGSVTALIHEFSQPFIRRMRAGRNWPRAGYLAQRLSPLVVRRILTVPHGPELIFSLVASPRDDTAVLRIVDQMRRGRGLPDDVLESITLSSDAIIEMWDKNREEAALAGTWMHWRFEAWLNRVPVPEEGPEFTLFLRYVGTLRGLVAFRTEWTIFADREHLAGSVDFAARDAAGSLCLFDWKRSRTATARMAKLCGTHAAHRHAPRLLVPAS